MSQDSPALPPIAVIGLAGRFPGARDADAFWRNLTNGVESITFFTSEELRLSGLPESWLTDARYVRANGTLADIELFDAELFDFTPREAEITDPQHRVLLECAWESLENAGYDPDGYPGRIGVYAGAGISTYLVRNLLAGAGLPPGVSDLQVLMGNNKDHVPTRISYKLNLKGPSINVSTACSTSLVAVHLACQGLLDYHCDLALAGGVGIQVPQQQGYWYEDGGIGSPDGHCRAFDARAAGTVSGNGAGIVVLKRLADAAADRDCIRAIIKGSAVNNDGRSKAGYTAPSVDGQAEVIAEALALAGVEADTIGYVEAHGTGTALGDPIEIAALTQAFRAGSRRRQFCAIGSVKTNIGHVDEAAGVAGLIKTVFALEQGRLPPSLHYEQPNPNIDFAASPFFVNTRLADWADSPRRAGVSSFGLGGTNAHVILEQPPARPASVTGRRWHLLPLSARSPEALDTAAANLAERVRQQLQASTDGTPESGAWLADAGYTLSVGRRGFLNRRVIVSDGMEAALDALQTGDSRSTVTTVGHSQPRPVVFLFPGQGAQHPGMGLELYRRERSFRHHLDQCADMLRHAFGYDFRDWLYPPDGADPDHSAAELGRTAIAQPVLFSVEYALARLLISWGIRPQAMIGHSLGEYVAACLAGVFPIEDGLKLVAARGALMEQLGRGGMLSVPLAEAESRSMLPPHLSIAATNSPCLTTVSGPEHAVRAFQQRLGDLGIGSHLLATAHAFHSAMVDPILPSLLDLLKTVRLRQPVLPYVSNVSGDWITAAQATDPTYWAAHSRQPVRFAEALEKVFGGTQPILLEVGPGRNLASAALRHPGKPAEQPVYTTLPHPLDDEPDDRVFLSAVGRLWTDGVPVDWTAFHANEQRYRIPLPAQPFNRQRYWIEGGTPRAIAQSQPHAVPPGSADKLADIARWFYVPSWRRSMLAPTAGAHPAATAKRWLLFLDDGGVGRQLAERLEQPDSDVVTVSMGTRFEQVASHRFVLDPGRGEHYESLLTALTAGGDGFGRIVHLWSLDSDPDPRSWAQAQDRGFYSLLFLAQSLRLHLADRHVRIDVISSGIHDVIGGEALNPAAATILGPVKVISQECPNIACRSIDVERHCGDTPAWSQLIERLSEELAADSPEGVIAWRGAHRWSQRFDSVRIDATNTAASRLKRGGAYLITGGLGGVGTILAEYLARELKARLALVSRTGLPSHPEPAPVTEQQDAAIGRSVHTSARDQQFLLADQAVMIATASDRIALDIEPRLIDDYKGFSLAADQLCASYIHDYFWKAAQPALRRGCVLSRDELDRALRIQPRFAKFVDFFLRVLCDDAIVRTTDDGGIEFLRHPSEITQPQSARTVLVQQFPDFAGILSLLDHCVRHYPAALSGEIAGIDVLYPGGSAASLEEAGRNTTFRTYRDVYMEVLKEIVTGACRRSAGRRIRILEVGIGDGILTRAIAPGLPADRVEYWATDIGRTFVVRGEQEAARAGLDFMHFAVFDIARGPEPAEIKNGRFDFVLGLDVVHATPRIEETLSRLRGLLAPGGVLALIETVATHRWVDMTWGLADGWWSFEDNDLRQSPLLGVAAWEAVLGRAGLAGVQAHPLEPSRRATADFGLILGQAPTREPALSTIPSWDSVTLGRMRNVKKLEELGSDVLVLAADVADEAEMKNAVAVARQRFGRIDGVIHAAGVTRGDIVFNLLDETTRASADALFRPKIQGSLVLARVLGDERLDFCLMISSNAAILGGLGLSAYAACNVFVDAFATAQSITTGQRWIAANWDGWPTEEVSAAAAQFQTSIDRFAMTRAECEQAFERVLVQSSPHIVVSSADLTTRLRSWIGPAADAASDLGIGQPTTAAEEPSPSHRNRRRTAASSLHERPNLSSEYVPAVTLTERRLCRIWQELFSIDLIGIDDNFFELRGDSLLATQLIATASKEFGIAIAIRSIFEHSSISRLAKVIDAMETAAALLISVPAHPLSNDEEEGSI